MIDPACAPNTYMHDLGVCCRQNYVDLRRKGYVASVLQAYQRHLADEQAKTTTKASKHVGQPEVRQEFADLVVVLAKSYMSGVYSKTLVKFRDPDGNILLWRASGGPQWVEVGKTFTVKATVKDHGQYQGVLETEIQRVVPVEAPCESKLPS